jgi:hypothetical protein
LQGDNDEADYEEHVMKVSIREAVEINIFENNTGGKNQKAIATRTT